MPHESTNEEFKRLMLTLVQEIVDRIDDLERIEGIEPMFHRHRPGEPIPGTIDIPVPAPTSRQQAIQLKREVNRRLGVLIKRLEAEEELARQRSHDA